MKPHASVSILVAVLGAACTQTSLQSPRVEAPGDVSLGAHIAVASAEDENGGEGETLGIFVATTRVGTEIGEFGGNIGLDGIGLSYKVPLLDQSGETHITPIVGAGLFFYLIPHVNVGLLVGQDLGPVTLYAGYRHFSYTGISLGSDDGGGTNQSGDAIGGLEFRFSSVASLMMEWNRNFQYSDSDFSDDFGKNTFTLGVNFGLRKNETQRAYQQQQQAQ